MALNSTLKFSGPIRVGSLSADPSPAEEGMLYYNTTSGKLRQYQAGAWVDATPTAAGASPSDTFRIVDASDPTKEIAFDASGIATGTTRTITMPDSNVNLGLVATAIQSSEKGANNGVATLDAGGKVPVAQLPNSVMEYKGNYNATTNSPTLADGTGNAGDVYRVGTAGTQDFGSGNITFVVGDYVIYNGSTWEKSHSGSDAVTSVNGFAGVVVLTTSDIAEGTNLYYTAARFNTAFSGKTTDNLTEGSTNLYYTAARFNAAFAAKSTTDLAEGTNLYYTAARFNTAFAGKSTTDLAEGSNLYYTAARFNTAFAGKSTTDLSEGSNLYFTDVRAQTAVVIDSIADSDTTHAPSRNAVFDALALKLSSVSQDTAPTLGGNLTLNAKSLLGPMNRAATGTPTSFVQEEYLDAITLTASSSNTAASALSFAFASFEGCEITYKIKEATTSRVRIGRLRVVTDGTNISIADDFNESADVGVTWTAVVNGSNIDLQYTTTANNKTMRADVKRFRA